MSALGATQALEPGERHQQWSREMLRRQLQLVSLLCQPDAFHGKRYNFLEKSFRKEDK